MFARKGISRKAACGPTRSAEHLLVWVYGKRCLRLFVISSSTNHGIPAVNFQRRELTSEKNGNLRVLTGFDACALEPRRRFVTERGKKQKAVANCVWMLVVKIEGIERIYSTFVLLKKLLVCF